MQMHQSLENYANPISRNVNSNSERVPAPMMYSSALKIGHKIDINILQVHVFILKKNKVYLEKQVSWKQKLMGRK